MRYTRQNKILEIIKNNEVETQGELARLLTEAGFKVTQATVSRDIRTMQLVKTISSSGKTIYAVPKVQENATTQKFSNILRETVVSVQAAGHIVVIKTLDGCANAAAQAIDTADNPMILGTIAGDNTIFCIVDSKEHVSEVVDILSGSAK